MTPDSKKAPPQTGNMGIVLVGIVVVGGAWNRLEPWVQRLWSAFSVHILLGAAVLSMLALGWLAAFIWNKNCDRKYERSLTAPDSTSVFLGNNSDGDPVHLKQRFRTMHTQVIGTTSAGKTESVILPWAIRDLETGGGFLMIDGKSDRSFLDKLYAYVVKTGRQKDFRLFSFSETGASTPFNPLSDGSASEVVERVFSSFTFENEYYRNVQYRVFQLLIGLILKTGKKPTFLLVYQLLSQPELLRQFAEECGDEGLQVQALNLLKESPRDRSEKLSGLEACVSHFANGDLAPLFNVPSGGISFDQALKQNLICYFQLPSMYFPFLAEATGKLVLQSFQNAVAKRHLGIEEKAGFFSCYLDDFQDYIYPGFGALLNKARSANIGVVFSHQALGDLDKVSPAFRNIVLTNTNIKCVMRNNDPETSEYFSKSFGTETTEKVTERRQMHLLGASKTGEGSVREVEQYKVHPNEIRGLGVGQGFVTIPHMKGVKTLKIYFRRRDDLPSAGMPTPVLGNFDQTESDSSQPTQGEKQTEDFIESRVA